MTRQKIKIETAPVCPRHPWDPALLRSLLLIYEHDRIGGGYLFGRGQEVFWIKFANGPHNWSSINRTSSLSLAGC